jgi:hypothetical protein
LVQEVQEVQEIWSRRSRRSRRFGPGDLVQEIWSRRFGPGDFVQVQEIWSRRFGPGDLVQEILSKSRRFCPSPGDPSPGGQDIYIRASITRLTTEAPSHRGILCLDLAAITTDILARLIY